MRKYDIIYRIVKYMTANILDGASIAQQELSRISTFVAQRINNNQRPPGLAVILVGQHPASQVYVKKKCEACNEVGFASKVYEYPDDIAAEVLLEKIKELNHTSEIDGILVQLPLPASLPSDKILESIEPHKDVDGFHAYNTGRLALNKPGLRPCTPAGIITLLSKTDLVLKGIEACMVGASNIVGRPMSLELLNRDATVTICHQYTRDLSQHCQRADLLIVAIGQPQFIQGNWIKPGAVVIDVGINRLPSKKIVGDVDFEAAKQRASWITPVPGGVGPMTVAQLLNNTLTACEKNTIKGK